MYDRQSWPQNYTKQPGQGQKIVHSRETVIRAAKMLAGGMSYTETAQILNVNRTTLWRWRDRKLFRKTYEKELAYYRLEKLKEDQRKYKELEKTLLPLLNSPNPYIAQQAALKILNSPFVRAAEREIFFANGMKEQDQDDQD